MHVYCLPQSIFWISVSDLSGCFVRRLCTGKKNNQYSHDANRVLHVSYQLLLLVLVLLVLFTHQSFSHQRQPMVFHWSLSDSKSPQISWTLLSILAVFNNAVVWMVSTRPPTSKSSSNPLVTVPNAPITIGIIVTCMFYSFFNSLARSRYLSFFFNYYYLLLQSFSHQYQLMVFHWSLSDSKSHQVSRTRISILAVFSNAVVWIVSTRPPTSKSSRPLNNPLVIVPNVPITIGTIVTFMFHSFFLILQQGRGTYPSFHFSSDLFCGPPGQQSQQFCRFIIIICEFFTPVLTDSFSWKSE